MYQDDPNAPATTPADDQPAEGEETKKEEGEETPSTEDTGAGEETPKAE